MVIKFFIRVDLYSLKKSKDEWIKDKVPSFLNLKLLFGCCNFFNWCKFQFSELHF